MNPSRRERLPRLLGHAAAHLKVAGIATLFGLGIYAAIMVMHVVVRLIETRL